MAEPNILPPAVQAAWDTWCDARARAVALSVSDAAVDAVMDVVGESTAKALDDQSMTILEVIDIMAVLATDNPLLSDKIDKLAESFVIDGKPHRVTRNKKRTTIRKSITEQTLDIIDEVLAT